MPTDLEMAEYQRIWRLAHPCYGEKWRIKNPGYQAAWRKGNSWSYYLERKNGFPAPSSTDLLLFFAWNLLRLNTKLERQRFAYRKWYVENRLSVNARCAENRTALNARVVARRNANPELKLIKLYRDRVNQALSGNRKTAPSLVLLGCSVAELRAHLEKQFQPGMTWANHTLRGWHVDHIKPCDSFPDLSDPAQQRECFHYSNLQPLWARENYMKGTKV